MLQHGFLAGRGKAKAGGWWGNWQGVDQGQIKLHTRVTDEIHKGGHIFTSLAGAGAGAGARAGEGAGAGAGAEAPFSRNSLQASLINSFLWEGGRELHLGPMDR